MMTIVHLLGFACVCQLVGLQEGKSGCGWVVANGPMQPVLLLLPPPSPLFYALLLLLSV
jgi:hypothetical protein